VCCLGGCEGVECRNARVDVFRTEMINIFKVGINVEGSFDVRILIWLL
jgi:hypothetical protein